MEDLALHCKVCKTCIGRITNDNGHIHKIHHTKLHYSALSTIFTEIYKHHYDLILEYIITLKGNSTLINTHSLFSSSPNLWQPLIYFLSVWICFFWTLYINWIIKHVPFSIWLLSLTNVSKVYPGYNMYQYFIIFIVD